MDNEKETVETQENNEELEETTEEQEEQTTEEKPQKKQFSDEERLAHHEGIVNRLKKKLGKDGQPETVKETPAKTVSDLDYGQKAFLRSYDIKGADEIALVKSEMARSGLNMDELVENEYFQGKLTKLREKRASNDAMPKGSKRTTVPQNDEQYWQGKIDSGQASLNDVPDVKVRRTLLNKRIEQAKMEGRFSENPIVQ